MGKVIVFDTHIMHKDEASFEMFIIMIGHGTEL